MKIAMALILFVTQAQAAPSLGLSYGRLSLDAARSDSSNLVQGMAITSLTVDMKLPIGRDFELSLGGGPSEMMWSAWDQTFALRTVFVDTEGNLIGVYGKAGTALRTQRLAGWNFLASLRYYFNEESR